MNNQSFSDIITFTRGSTATYFGADRLLKTAAIGEPRFDHDPVTGERIGLLIEESRTNLLTYSEQFDNAAWLKAASSVAPDAAAAPDGQSNAEKLVEDTALALHTAYRSIAVIAGTFTLSVFLKSAERTKARVIFATAGIIEGAFVIADLSNGTLGAITNRGSTTGSTASISSAGSGWYRVTLTVPVATAATYYAEFDLVTGASTTSYTGDGASGLYIWGAQLESGVGATSYIHTTLSQVTRFIDSITLGASPWAGDAGTYIVEAKFYQPASSSVFVLDRGASGRIWYDAINSDTECAMQSYNGATIINAGSASRDIFSKAALAFGGGQMRSCVNGGAIASGSHTGAFGSGDLAIGSTRFNGYVKSVRFYPYAMTNAELQAITA